MFENWTCPPQGLCQKSGDIRTSENLKEGCIDKYPERGGVLAPWVMMRFIVGQQVITVSNRSSPDSGNNAVIKSFEYGHTDGFSAKFVIEDQEGGGFVNVVQHMFKDWKAAINGAGKYEIQFQFGWVKSDCSVPSPDAVSPCIYAWVMDMETNFSGGKYLIEFTATDLMKRMPEGGEEKAKGSDDQKVCLKDAIIDLFTKSKSPNVKTVEFRKIEHGIVSYVGFEESDKDCAAKNEPNGDNTNRGPKHSWRPEGEDKITTARRWLSPYRSENKKGWAVTTVPTDPEGKIIIWEDRPPPCKNMPVEWWQTNCIGHYRINASKFSPVLEFNPKFRWTFDHLINHGGIASGSSGHVAAGDPSERSKPIIDCKPLSRPVQQSGGSADTHVTTPNMRDKNGEQSAQKTVQGHEASARADARWFPSILEAQLVIVGDPCLCRPDEMFGRTVTLTMYNPFFIRSEGAVGGMGGQDKYEWYAIPPRNCVITNAAWIVVGISHRIELGKYTTTLQLMIAAPGVDGPPCANLGLIDNGWNPCLSQC